MSLVTENKRSQILKECIHRVTETGIYPFFATIKQRLPDDSKGGQRFFLALLNIVPVKKEVKS